MQHCCSPAAGEGCCRAAWASSCGTQAPPWRCRSRGHRYHTRWRWPGSRSARGGGAGNGEGTIIIVFTFTTNASTGDSRHGKARTSKVSGLTKMNAQVPSLHASRACIDSRSSIVHRRHIHVLFLNFFCIVSWPVMLLWYYTSLSSGACSAGYTLAPLKNGTVRFLSRRKPPYHTTVQYSGDSLKLAFTKKYT